MTSHYDDLETRKPEEREADLFSQLPDVLRNAMPRPHTSNTCMALTLPRSLAAPPWRPFPCCANLTYRACTGLHRHLAA